MCDQDDDDTCADGRGGGKKGDQSDTAYTDLLMQPKFTELSSRVSKNQKYPQALRGGFVILAHYILYYIVHITSAKLGGFPPR